MLDGYTCKRCGTCCSSFEHWDNLSELKKMAIKMSSPQAEEFMKRIQNGRCPYLSFDNGMAKCNNYENRPLMCRNFPYKKEDIEQTCNREKKKGFWAGWKW